MKARVLLVMMASAIAAATGFLREMVVAYLFGTSAAADAFSLILVYIEGLYVVVMVGIAGYMLVPLVVRIDNESGRRSAERLIETLQLWTALAFLPLLLTAWLAPGATARAMAPGFNALQHEFLSNLVPAGALCAALLVIGGLMGGVLQARSAYLGPVISRGAFNLGVVGMLYASVREGTVGAAARGLVVGGVLQVLLQAIALWRTGWRPGVPRFQHLHLGSAVAAGFPVVLALFLVNFIAVAAQRAIGSHLAEGSLAAVNYAQRTLSVVSFLTMSIGTVSLTGLSTAVTQDATGGAARAALGKHLSALMWLVVPLSLWMAVAAAPLVAVLFRRGAYTPEALVMTAACVRWFAASLVPGGLLMILQRAGSAWNRNWLVTYSGIGTTIAMVGVTELALPLGPTALPMAVLCGNLAGLAVQVWLMRAMIGPLVLSVATRATSVFALRAVVALVPLLVLRAWFLTVDETFFVLGWRLLSGLGLAATLYVGISLATGDQLTKELVSWINGTLLGNDKRALGTDPRAKR